MTKQEHGGDIYRNQCQLDFSVNMNPLGVPEEIKKAVIGCSDWLDTYPDTHCEELRRLLAEKEQLNMEQILCGNGATALIYALTFFLRPKKAMVLSPTFSEYEKALKLVEAEINVISLREDLGFVLQEEDIPSMEGVDLLFLCNPNNPTGEVISRQLLEVISGKCEETGTYLVIDECFLPFVSDGEELEMSRLIGRYPHLLILKAFTKTYSIPGLRLGYLLGEQKLLENIRNFLPEWDVSVPAQEAGKAALRMKEDFMKETQTFLSVERAYLKQALMELGFTVYNSKANYVFFSGEKGLYKKLLNQRILIRDCAGYPGLREGYYRIAVRSREENERLLTCLRKL